MQKCIRYFAIFLIAITASFYALLQFDAVQEWGKKRAQELMLQHTGCTIEVSRLRGTPPFLLGLDDVAISHPDLGSIKIDSITIIPSWLEILFGKIAFLWVTADGVDITKLSIKRQEDEIRCCKDLFSQIPFAIHSLHADKVLLPKEYYAPLLTTYSEQSEVHCHFSISGSLSWSPGSEHLSSKLSVTPYAGDLSIITASAALDSTQAKTTLDTTIDAMKAPEGSVFKALPFDRLTFDTTLSANTEDVLKKLFSNAPVSTPFISGSWSASGVLRQKPLTTIRFGAKGTLEAETDTQIAFGTQELTCQKIEPITRPDKSSLFIENEEPQDLSSLTRITNIPTPSSIEGRVKYEDKTLRISLAALDLPQDISSCSLHCTLSSEKEALQGSCKLDLDVSEFPIALSSDFTSSDNILQFPNVLVDLAGYEIKGKLDATLFPFTLKGSLKNTQTDAKELASLLQSQLTALRCEATFNDSVHVVVDAEGYKGPHLSCKKANLTLTASNPYTTPEFLTLFTAYHVDLPSLLIDTAKVQYSSQNPFSISLKGQSKNGPCSLDCIGKLTTNMLAVDSCKILSAGHTITTNSPFTLQRKKQGFTLSPFQFTSDSGMHLAGDAAVTSQNLNINVACENLPLEWFDPILQDLSLYGNVSGHCNISGPRTNPQGILRLASSELTFWNPKKSTKPPLTASCEVTLENSLAKGTCEIEGLSLKKPSTLYLQVPLTITPTLITFNKNKKLSGNLAAEFDVNTLLTSYFDEDEIMDGIIQVHAKFDGTPARPIVIGNLEWKEGKIFIPAVGMLFNTIQLSGELHKNEFVADQITATDGKSGKFEGSGRVKDFLTSKLSYEVNGLLADFASIALDEVHASSTGNLKLTGDLHQAMLSGTLDVVNAEAILTPLSKNIPTLDITYVGHHDEAFIRKKPFQFGLDLDLHMDAGKVRGMGLDSTWKGNARLFGKGALIDVNGKIALTSGTLTFADKVFALTHGSIDFTGDPLKKSKLQVAASNDVGQISTQIVLLGSLSDPRIVIQSNPAMSEKEILSWLLFNKSSIDITPIEGIQLGKTLLQLKGTSGNIDFLEEIKQRLHIDRLDVGPSGSTRPLMNTPGTTQEASSTAPAGSVPNEVSVHVGKYISDGVIVTLSKDVTNEVNRVGVEANLSEHITAQANVGDDSEAQLSLEWKLRY